MVVKNSEQPPAKQRCGAKTRKGTPCMNWGIRCKNGNYRCRMHGGLGSGAPQGNKNAWKHGQRTREAIKERRMIRFLIRAIKSGVLDLQSLRVD